VLTGPDTTGGWTFSSFLLLGFVCYALYMIAKKYLSEVQHNNYRRNFQKRDFADGFM
jgi:hypothetical protein